MRTFDFAPLYRSTVGFDRLFSLLDQSAQADPTATWPPYNIERVAADSYRITMAVAGFAPDEIELTQHDTTLHVAGQKASQEGERQYLHRGIAGRAFERRFVLADHIQVQGADMENGLLHVSLKREVPEALKPRRIAIGTAAPRAALEVANESGKGQPRAA